MKDLKKRTITAVVLISCILPILYFGGVAMDILCGALTVGAAYELEKMYTKKHEKTIFTYADVALSFLTFLVMVLSVYLNVHSIFLIYSCALFLLEGSFVVFDSRASLDTMGRSLVTMFYPSIGFASLAYIRNMETSLYKNGLFVVLYVMLVCMMTDMFAYLFGCKIGKHKMCPNISPKKSWEGFFMGVLLGTVIGSAFALLSGVKCVLFPELQPLWQSIMTIIATIFLCLVEVVGDLVASKFKRGYEIKDYSNIFPGHGGVLDRFDSYIFASVALMFILLV